MDLVEVLSQNRHTAPPRRRPAHRSPDYKPSAGFSVALIKTANPLEQPPASERRSRILPPERETRALICGLGAAISKRRQPFSDQADFL